MNTLNSLRELPFKFILIKLGIFVNYMNNRNLEDFLLNTIDLEISSASKSQFFENKLY